MNAVTRTDALIARTRALFECQVPAGEVIRHLRADGFGFAESIAALIKQGGMTAPEARAAVVDSPTWADMTESQTGRWIPVPPTPPDDETLERLRAACAQEPRIVEAWLTGRRDTRADGTSEETTGIAVVFDAPFSYTHDVEQTREPVARLRAAAARADLRRWVLTERFGGYDKTHALRIYGRAAEAT